MGPAASIDLHPGNGAAPRPDSRVSITADGRIQLPSPRPTANLPRAPSRRPRIQRPSPTPRAPSIRSTSADPTPIRSNRSTHSTSTTPNPVF
jgi:hypothetical protein